MDTGDCAGIQQPRAPGVFHAFSYIVIRRVAASKRTALCSRMLMWSAKHVEGKRTSARGASLPSLGVPAEQWNPLREMRGADLLPVSAILHSEIVVVLHAIASDATDLHITTANPFSSHSVRCYACV